MPYVGVPSEALTNEIVGLCEELNRMMKGKDATIAANACLRYAVALLCLSGVTAEQARTGFDVLVNAYLSKGN